MVALYLVSAEEAPGKTTISAGIGKRLLNDGKKVGFLKPIFPGDKSASNSDAVFMKQVLALSEAIDLISPVIGGKRTSADKIKEAYGKVAGGKDVVLIEGRCGESPNDNLSKATYQLAEALPAKVVMVVSYANPPSLVKLPDSYRRFGGNLLGMVVNKVPRSRLFRVADEVSARFKETGVKVLGVLPEDRLLLTLTVGEIAEAIQGEILNNAENSAELVENFMLGAMYVDSGLEYFGRKHNKAVILRSDRPDHQMAALETSTKCLVITGNGAPIPYVRSRAESRGIPIILARNDTSTVIRQIEEARAKSRFNQERKLKKLSEIMEQYFDFPVLYQGLGF